MAPFKRYWQVDIWSRLFDLMLNHESLEPLAELGDIRYGFIGGA